MSGFEMNQKEAHALAGYLALIRLRSGGPEWHKAGIEDALARARHLAPSPDLAVAAIKAAREPTNRTPAVIGLEGPHWQGSTTAPRRPYDSNATCGVCGFTETECRRRWTGDHDFESVAQSKARKEDEQDTARIVADLRANGRPTTRGTTMTDDLTPQGESAVRLALKVAAVRALADEWDTPGADLFGPVFAAKLRQALDGTEEAS